MSCEDRSEKICIVGAGSSGLAAAKALQDANIAFDCLEREDDVGGNWYFGRPHSSVYASTHTISSKRLTEYVDFPMPDDFPDYPHHSQVCDYLRRYARHFGLYKRIEFGQTITSVERSQGGRRKAEGGTTDDSSTFNFQPSTSPLPPWIVRLQSGVARRYRGMIVANGHNWDPRFPEFPGSFDGLSLHACRYKTPEALQGKRVLVVGAGNSGCDIACEAAQHAARVVLSMRRGYHYLPKFWRGRPIDELNERLHQLRVPLAVRRGLAHVVERVALGRPETFGLPQPDHRLLETHPIINSQLFYYAAHGRIVVRPNVAELCRDEVRFADGSREPFDVIVYATGYKISFPFLDRELLNWRDGKPQLFLNVFHPRDDDLFVIGLIQPDSGQFGLVDYQSRLVARFISACDRRLPQAADFRRLKATQHLDLSGGVRYVDSPRHLLEVEHYSYRERLKRLLRRLESG